MRALAFAGAFIVMGAAEMVVWPLVGPRLLGLGGDVVARIDPVRARLHTALAGAAHTDLAGFYAARRYRPLWLHGARPRSEAVELIALLRDADADGLSPQAYQPERLAALVGDAHDPRSLADAEIALSRAFAAYVGDLRRPAPGATTVFADPALQPPPTGFRAVLEEAGHARSLQAHLVAVHAMNPIYAALRQALAERRALWDELPPVWVPPGSELAQGKRGVRVAALKARLGLSGEVFDAALARRVALFQGDHGLPATGIADRRTIAALNRGPLPYDRMMAANLERARSLPPTLGARFILVNVPAQTLWFVDGGALRGPMRVVVGKPGEPTPAMVGVVRYAVFNPYWNVPPDLVRRRIARRALRRGAGALAAQHLETLSSWSDDAATLPAAGIDWAAVAAGRQTVRVRQAPGPDNMMGQVKFVFPNALGVYLHDTPRKALFGSGQRTFSAGCVRLQNAAQLADWLYGRAERGTGEPEHRIDLPRPVPVYITYFTIAPAPDGLTFLPDIYGRDRRLVAELAKRDRLSHMPPGRIES